MGLSRSQNHLSAWQMVFILMALLKSLKTAINRQSLVWQIDK